MFTVKPESDDDEYFLITHSNEIFFHISADFYVRLEKKMFSNAQIHNFLHWKEGSAVLLSEH